MSTRRLFSWAVVTSMLGACSSSSRLAPVAEVPNGPDTPALPDSILVPYPPPPALVEIVPPPPSNPDCVWVDGQWLFEQNEYAWHSGTWVVPPRGCAYAPARFFWDESKANSRQLRYRSGRWLVPSAPFTQCPQPASCTNASLSP